MIGMTLHKQGGPSYKAVTIEFPAPEFELQEKLNSIGVGISHEKNCFVSSYTGIGVLSFLVNELVNADEVQFLAKRLDSFDKSELQTFSATVSVEKPKTIKDLINLTFNTHCYTVISDFSDIEKIGRAHELNRQGSMTMRELEKLDGAAIGRKLIASGNGMVTPFGVLYRNGNQPEKVYNGEQFPEYYYRSDYVATVSLEFGGAHEYLYLPCAEVEIEKAANRLVLPQTDVCNAEMDWYELNETILHIFTDNYRLSENLYTLNELCRCYCGFDMAAEKAFNAIVELANPQNPEEVLMLAQNFYEFSAVPDIHTAEDYGRYIVEQSCEFSGKLEKYIDFSRFGGDIIAKEDGEFTEWGYIGYLGNTPAVLEILQADRQEQNIAEQQPDEGMTMGGIVV